MPRKSISKNFDIDLFLLYAPRMSTLLSLTTPVAADDSAAAAALCKAAADSSRIQVLALLHENSFSVGELVDILDIRQSALSHHLKILLQAQLVSTRREGNSIFYRQHTVTGSAPLDALRKAILTEASVVTLPVKTADRLTAIYSARASASVAFFKANADKFRNEQDLIADHYHYGDAVAQLLDNTAFSENTSALEIGPGDGAFLPELSRRFTKVCALDNSEEMLAKAQRYCRELGFDNMTYVSGDTTSDALAAESFHCIVTNMVLHHVAAPAQIFRDIRRLLAPRGIVTITELCRHEQTWAHSACGDLWLGFEPDELSSWAQAAGLAELTQTILAQRNGFQLQIRQFQRL